MKKSFLVGIGIIIFSGMILPIASAHPGNTIENGSHQCHTNCEKWGVPYEQYHFHEKKIAARTEARKKARKSF